MTRWPFAWAFAALMGSLIAESAGAVQRPACDPAANPHCQEIERLAAEPAVRAAFEFIMETADRATEDLIRLTQIPAPPFMEDERARAYAELFREAGVDSLFIDDEGNVVGVRRGTGAGPVVALAGHLDTVFPEGTDVTVRQRGDTLFAPGIGDDTRGLVVVLQVLRAMNHAGLRTEGDVLFIGTVGEEGLGDLRGVKHLFREGGPRIDAFVAVDGGGDSRIVNQGLGSRRYRATFRGPGGHSWGAFGLANPAHALGRAIRLLDDAAHAFTAAGPRTSYNVGRIGGGTSVNSIPYEAWMEVDMRSVDPRRLATIDSLFQTTTRAALEEQNEARRHGPTLELELDLVGDRPSGTTPPDSPLVLRAKAAVRHFGLVPSLGIGSTDSNVPIALGVPAVTVGRGGVGGNTHALDEWWLDRDGHIAIQRTLLLLLAQAGFVGAAPP